jgi:hypothetical protein
MYSPDERCIWRSNVACGRRPPLKPSARALLLQNDGSVLIETDKMKARDRSLADDRFCLPSASSPEKMRREDSRIGSVKLPLNCSENLGAGDLPHT